MNDTSFRKDLHAAIPDLYTNPKYWNTTSEETSSKKRKWEETQEVFSNAISLKRKREQEQDYSIKKSRLNPI